MVPKSFARIGSNGAVPLSRLVKSGAPPGSEGRVVIGPVGTAGTDGSEGAEGSDGADGVDGSETEGAPPPKSLAIAG